MTEQSVVAFSSLSGITASVVSVRAVDQELCLFGQDAATAWGRTSGAFLVIVLAASPERGQVCLNRQARRRLAHEGADIPAALSVFDQLVSEQRWASAVTNLLKGLLPGRSGQLRFPDPDVEAAVPVDRSADDSDEVAAYLIVLGLPLLYLVCFGLWEMDRHRRMRSASGSTRSQDPPGD